MIMNKNSSKSCGYMLCSSPRSGSTLLCDLLSQSSVAGNPKSYFRPGSIPDFCKDWGILEGQEDWSKSYIKAFKTYSSNGTDCSSLRIMWSNFKDFIDFLRQNNSSTSSDKNLILDSLSIDHYKELSMLEDEADGWEEWFKSNNIEPLRVWYEDLSSDPLAVLDRIMDFIGRSSNSDIKVRTARTSSDLNKQWSDRFKREALALLQN
jgi:LPS sulfotransferase NodH